MSAPCESQHFTKMSPIKTSVSRFLALFCLLFTCNFAYLQAEVDFYSLSAIDIRGNDISFEIFRGKPTLVVNVASSCGYTNQHYSELAWIYDHNDFRDKLNILAFPCNQFGQQEPGTPVAIEKQARDVFKARFPIFYKIDTIGENAHPVYNFLKEATGKEPTWNFWKYLVDADGKVLHAWGPKVTVLDIYSQLYKQVKITKPKKENPNGGNEKTETLEDEEEEEDTNDDATDGVDAAKKDLKVEL